MNILKMAFSFVKSRVILSTLVIAIVAAGGYLYFRQEPDSGIETITARRADILQEISVTGRVKPAEDVDLAFEKSGRVTGVNVEIGDKANTGEVLAFLSAADLSAQLSKAEANLEVERSKLNELKRGTRPEEIKIQETKVANAKTALDDSKRTLADKIRDAYTKSDDAIRIKIDELFINPSSADPQLAVSGSNPQIEIDLKSGRLSLELILNSWLASLTGLSSSEAVFFSENAKTNLNQVRAFLEKITLFLNGLSASTSLSQATIDGYKTNASSARTNISTATTNLLSAEEDLRIAESNLAVAESELLLKKAGTIPEQIAAQQARVKSAEADVKDIEAQIAKTIIFAPISGIVTKQNAKVGEIVSANTSVITIISEASFEIEANVPEADFSRLEIGNSARVSLDAYGSQVLFDAKVVKIDPAETIIEGVATYKATLQFLEKDSRIRSGMTANIDILNEKKEGVIVVPFRAVFERNGEKFARIYKNGGSILEVPVETGLRGSDGNIEIISGIDENDRVIVFLPE